jgi:hypothetical protein
VTSKKSPALNRTTPQYFGKPSLEKSPRLSYTYKAPTNGNLVMRASQKVLKLMPDPKMIGAWIAGFALGALFEGLHWALFEPKAIGAWIAVLAAAAALIKYLYWELYGRPEEPAAWSKT